MADISGYANSARVAPFARGRQRTPVSTYWWDIAAVVITVVASSYFLILAFLNAHVFPVTYAVVAASEALILLSALFVVVRTGLRDADALPLALLFAFVLLTVGNSLLNDTIYPDPLRNMAIIAVFTMLGLHMSLAVADRIFVILSIATLAFLAIELASTDLYVAILKPAYFFQNFRGYEAKPWDESGLFGNAMSFSSRWSFGLFSHRTASIFIEQVSLANFSGVLTVMLLTRWPSLSWRARALFVTTAVMILLTNSSRTSTIMAVVSVAAYRVYPLMPRYGTVAVAPLILVFAFCLTAYTGLTKNDDLVGRVSITVRALTEADLGFWLGAAISRAAALMDTGYAYMIASTSVFGLLFLWLYISFIVPQCDAMQKRCAYALALYVFGNLLIGGTAIFAMKVAAPLWILVGATAKRNDRP